MAQAKPILDPDSWRIQAPGAAGVARAPVDRIVEGLLGHSAILIVVAESDSAAEWLTERRIGDAIGHSLMGPTDVEIWSATDRITIVSLGLPSIGNSAPGTFEIHALSQSSMRNLAQQWTEQREGAAPFKVTPITRLSHVDDIQSHISELNSLLEILVNRQLTPQFQPIVSLYNGRIFGYETLIRGPRGALLRRPGQMFRVADKARVVAWFDLACLEVCLEAAAHQHIRHQLFINMDAEGLSAMAMQERPMAMRVRDHGVLPSSVVIEITERQMVQDFPRLIDEIKQLREDGFRIAIDDAGAGYSSLRAVAELRPDFVKIDRDLVKSIDVVGERRALLRALVQFAQSSGSAVVAEGAETREELTALIDLGISYCQGYVLGRPTDALRGTTRELRAFVQERVAAREIRNAGFDGNVGSIACAGSLFESTTPLSEAARRFAKEPGLTSIAVMEDGRVVGLLMRNQFDHVISVAKAAQAAEMMPVQEVCRWMRTDILKVRTDARLQDVVRQVVAQSDLPLDLDIVLLDADGLYQGIVPVRSLLDAATTQPIRRARYCDPLTGLPGRVMLERDLRSRLSGIGPLAVLRVDVAHLASINEQYGLDRGDELIIAVAELIVSAHSGGPDDTVAHLGGDNFVIVTGIADIHALCGALVDGFGKVAAPFAGSGDARTISQSRPPCALTVAAVTNRSRRLHSAEQAMNALHALIRGLRAQAGSCFAVDALPARGR